MTHQIAPGDKVTIHYRVFAGKEMVDASSKPVSFKVGSGEFFPFVEKALIGHRPGEKIIVFVPPEEHYGPYDPKKLQIIPVEKLPSHVHPGEIVKVQDEIGVVHPAILRKKDPWIALVDLNHPFAGKVLRFEVEIIEVEPEGRFQETDQTETDQDFQGGKEQ